MTIKFSTVDNGARNSNRPFIQANVDGVRVRWSVDHGWRCDACPESFDDMGDGVTLVSGVLMCSHALTTFDHLSRRIQDRINHLVDIGVAGRKS